ncbi:hypothetical protein QJS04_geneDACA006165 [Acorus gramineus]|uniref:Uncharacterized protein n=1 Tax=Acorus gramineus TaxID=55184 RepID=A0AAV9B3R0_ACOGR|nr:hypothetical protein QJS04_geneDACA006165 [Acorus gramineus]
MGLTVISDDVGSEHYHTHKAFLLANYILIGAASSCIFLTLSLRLIPSLCGLSLIALHLLTIAGAISGCTAASNGSVLAFVLKYYAYVEGGGGGGGLKRSGKVGHDEELNDWPWPLQV